MKVNIPLSKRVARVKADLVEQGIGKNSQVTGGGRYKYRGVDDTMATVSALHVKHGVNVSIIEISNFGIANSGGVHMSAIMTFGFMSSDDPQDFLRHVVVAEGKDSQDKASGKLHSYGYKNCMFSFYEIPVAGQSIDDYDPRIDNEESDNAPIAEGDAPKESLQSGSKSTKGSKGKGSQASASSVPETKTEEPELQSIGSEDEGDPPFEIPLTSEDGIKRMNKIASLIMENPEESNVRKLVTEARWLRDEHKINGGAFDLVRKQAKLAHIQNNTTSQEA